MKNTELTAKERLFCSYYSLGRNAREAAAKAGYRKPERNAQRLLENEQVLALIQKIDRSRKNSDRAVAAGFYRLAFGSVTDAIRLLLDDSPDLSELESMDLFSISDIKRPKGGGLEIKFFDRLKALERLQDICDSRGDAGDNPFYEAIAKGARALNGADELE